jgi:hypothetical protein
MSKGEVKSLNDLAMAHGGHLTINPHTGLPEAGFLSRILPMIAGAGLMMVPGMQPLAASAIVGAGYAAKTGSLSKGLMAGLGAYSGAGLGSALTSAGASSITPAVEAAAPAATPAAAPAPVVETPPTPVSTTVPAPSVTSTNIPSWNANQPFANQTMVSPTVAAPAPVTVTPASATTLDTTATAPNYSYELKGNTPGIRASLDTSTPSRFSLSGQSGNYNLANPMPSPASIANPAPSPVENMTPLERLQAMKSGATFDNLTKFAKENPMQVAGMAVTAFTPDKKPREKPYRDADPGQQYSYEANAVNPAPNQYGQEQKYYNQQYTRMASGGLSDAQYNLGGYSDGGRLLRGPGDGVSDSIPAVIGKKQPARLADGEFVVPARIVSELGNGSTEAGARKLYAMMDRIQKTRSSTVGKGKVAKNSRADKHLPA